MTTAATTGVMNLLTRVSRDVYRRATEDVIGIGLKKFIALDYLREQGGTSQSQLGETLHLDKNNCVILLNELEDPGYVERLRDPTDRRRHLVAITPAGAKALETAEEKLETLEEEGLRRLTPDERAKLAELLRKAIGADDPAADR
jgi:DNA-binding MarR family transcriptional regulator